VCWYVCVGVYVCVRACVYVYVRACVCLYVCVCACVKFCCKLGKHFTETFQLLNKSCGEDSMSRTQRCDWFKSNEMYL
jgi:hypothetical protein